jgi:hypothetical protein
MRGLSLNVALCSSLRVLVLCRILASVTVALSFPLAASSTRQRSSSPALPVSSLRHNTAFLGSSRGSSCILASSFFGKFDEGEEDEEDEDEDDEEDDDDDDIEMDKDAVANFRNKMSGIFGDSSTDGSSENESTGVSSVDELINFARGESIASSGSAEVDTDWARPVSSDELTAGVVLVANPAKFCSDFGGRPTMPSPKLLAKFGLTLPPPAELGPDRRADLLPVLVLVDMKDERGSTRAVLLNRRTGYLLGDLEQQPGGPAPILEKFCIQPLWFGGVDNVSSGLDMMHLCPTVQGAKALTTDGLYWGGEPAQAQDAMSDPSLDRVFTGFDFKFFVQSTLWKPGELQAEIAAGTWFCATVSKEVLFKSRDRMGTMRAKPLWTEIMENLSEAEESSGSDGPDFLEIRNQLYDDE